MFPSTERASANKPLKSSLSRSRRVDASGSTQHGEQDDHRRGQGTLRPVQHFRRKHSKAHSVAPSSNSSVPLFELRPRRHSPNSGRVSKPEGLGSSTQQRRKHSSPSRSSQLSNSSVKSYRSGYRERRSSSSSIGELAPSQKFMTPSMLSLISTVTGGTSSSSGSNTTVTQTSYSHKSNGSMRNEPTRKPPRKRNKRERRTKDISAPKKQLADDTIGVFKYLEQHSSEPEGQVWQPDSSSSDSDDLDSSVASPVIHERRRRRHRSISAATDIDGVESSVPDHMHDSGISVGSNSPIPMDASPDKRKSVARGAPSPLSEASLSDPYPYSTLMMAKANGSPGYRPQDGFQPLQGYQSPYHVTYPRQFLQHAWPHVSERPYEECGHRESDSESESTTSEEHFESFVRRISAFEDDINPGKGLIPPIYRRFEWIHNRLLLHLQHEISRLEQQLKSLDGKIASNSTRRDRNSSSQFCFEGNLDFQRKELLGQIFLKINQYDQGLSAYSSAVRDHRSASAGEIEHYRQRLGDLEGRSHLDISNADIESDLIRVSHLATHAKSADFVRWLALAPPAGCLTAVLLMSSASHWVARMFSLLVIGMLSFVVLYWTTFVDPLGGRDRGTCFALYIGVMLVMASLL